MDDNQIQDSGQSSQSSQPAAPQGTGVVPTQDQAAAPQGVSQRAKRYRIKVDRNLCIGAASCVALAAKTFALDSENKAIVIDDNGDLPESIKLAAESCPTKAIILENIETGEQEYP